MEFTRVKNFINGEWVEDPKATYIPLHNPSTGEVIGEVPMSSTEASIEAVKAADAAFPAWKNTSIGKRVGYLFAMRQAILDHQEELAVAIATDQAKHVSEARGEVMRVVQIFEAACSIPTLMQGENLDKIAGGINGRVTKEPLGVFGGVAPFNFPALVFGWFIPYAIGTGNTFVYKPSNESPLFMQIIGDIFNEVGLPKGVVNIIHGDPNVVEAWYDRPEVAGVCLVGSSPTAKAIAQGCGKNGKRSMLLGGAKNFLVVMEDANMDVFIENFIHSAYGSAGQRCLAGSIIAVVPDVYDECIERMVEASKKVTVGDAMDPDVYMGPVITKEAKERIEKYIEIGIEGGSKLVLDGRNPEVPEKNKGGYFVGPTIFTDVTPCRTIAQEEVFGPFVSVMKINDLNDVLGLIKEQPFGNGACIFTQNQYYTEKFISDANVGMVGVNVGVCAPHPYLPFGGIKDSLVGSDKVQGKDGIDFFTQNKVATIRVIPPEGVAECGTRVDGDKSVRSCVAE